MRIVVPEVLAIEVWDLPVEGRPLQAWRHDPAFATRLAAMVAGLRDAPALASAREVAARIGHVHLVGGAADDTMTAAIAATGLPCTRSRDPFAAARAGVTLVPGAACADLGQTSVKLVDGERTIRIARDLSLAPMRDSVAPYPRRIVREATVRWLASILSMVAAPRVVLALPCEIAGELPRSCTYCWPDPDPALIPDLARLSNKSIAFLNDAELAARAAALDPAVPRDAVTLVLTIGFGVGGALLAPRTRVPA